MKTRKHILIVDDVTTNLRFLGEVLKDEYSLSMSKSGKQALKLLEKTIPDLILLDVKMPEMDGYETYSRIKANNKTANIPVVFLSADSQKENEEKGLKLGASAFIHKPFEPSALLYKVEEILTKQDAENEIQILANSDTLTGLWNRKYLEKTIKDMNQDSTKALFFLLNFNLVKNHNDKNAKWTEEAMLIKIGKCISSFVHKEDIVSRIGGFEFGILMKNMESVDDVRDRISILVEDINSALKNDLSFDIDTFLVSGISIFPEHGRSFVELYNAADKAIVLSGNKEDFHIYDPNKSAADSLDSTKDIIEVSQLQSLIEDDDSLEGPMIVEYSDFKDLYRFMKRYAQRTGERLQLVLFTLKDLSGCCKKEDFDRSLNVLETAIRTTLRKNDAASKYSDSQFLVILSDLSNTNRSEVIQRVTECFETTSGNADIILKVDIDDSVLE